MKTTNLIKFYNCIEIELTSHETFEGKEYLSTFLKTRLHLFDCFVDKLKIVRVIW